MSREMPGDWRQLTLGAVAGLITDRWDPGEEYNLPYIGLEHLGQGTGRIIATGTSGGLASMKTRFHADDVLFGKLRPNLRKSAIAPFSGIASTDIFVLRARDLVDSNYLFYLLSSDECFDFAVRTSAGTKMPRTSWTDMASYLVKLPPLPEQRRIAEILSSVDDAIQTTKAVIEQTRKVKDGVLERLLTEGIGHTKFKDSPFGLLPRNWSTVDANSICEQISVGIVIRPSQYYVPYGIKCFRSANIGEGFIKDTGWVYISPESDRLLRKSRLRAGDVLVVRSGYPGTSCVVTQDFDGSNCIDIIFARPKQQLIVPSFLSSFINSRFGRDQIARVEGGLAQKHFNVGEMKKMLVPVPPLSEQVAISARIAALARAEYTNAEILIRLHSLKSALSSDLLTGHKRVMDALPLAAE